MRILVCGSRDWGDRGCIEDVLNGLLQTFKNHNPTMGEEFVVIEGAGRGADEIAGEWAEASDDAAVFLEQYPADWKKHGKAAGPIRNQQMLDEGKPDVVWAFKDNFNWSIMSELLWTRPGAGGTEDMVRRAKAAGIPCYVVSRA